MNQNSLKDSVIVSITLSAEADSEPEAKEWIAWTIYNRSKHKAYPDTMAGGCLQKFQYSEWNTDIADRINLERVLKMPETGNPNWTSSVTAFNKVMSDIGQGNPDPTNGSTHFYADSIEEPNWAKSPSIFRGSKGRVRFYSNVN